MNELVILFCGAFSILGILILLGADNGSIYYD